MKLKYKILWIEDEPKSIKREATKVKKYLNDDYGFECKNDDITIKNYEEFQSEFIDTDGKVKSKIEEFDLLLVDFDLGEEEHTGDILIDIIRKSVYSEILFYSSNYEELRSKLDQHFIDGVFTSNRDELEEKVKKLINVTIKKVQDVNNLRGLIMAEVAELDRIKERIISNASSKVSGKKLERYILKKIKSSGNTTKNQAEGHLEDISNVSFNGLFSKIGFVDSNKKAMTIGEVLKECNINNPVCKDTFFRPYKEKILDRRNIFAHVEECDISDENGNTCKFINDIPFTEEKCIEIRKEIKDYKKILIEIEKQL